MLALPSWPIQWSFQPDYTEKHKKTEALRSHSSLQRQSTTPPPDDDDDDDDEVTFWDDFCAGGAAGCASVVVGHPLDTIKVRMQTTNTAGPFNLALFRGMIAPLSAATFINATVFGSYGLASRLYDDYFVETSPRTIIDNDATTTSHDSVAKAVLCGSFAGAVQCTLICPMELVKCRLQLQAGTTPTQLISLLVRDHGPLGLYRGWWATIWREVPAFGLYFASYDYFKDCIQGWFEQSNNGEEATHAQILTSSALAGGTAGALTWAIVYPVDVIKTHIQTSNKTMGLISTTRQLVQQHGVRYLFRGLSIALVRAFPVNGTIFPVYEWTLQQMAAFKS